MPETTGKILKQLNAVPRDYKDLDTFGLLENGTKVVEKTEILFARLDVNEVLEKAEELRQKQLAALGIKE